MARLMPVNPFHRFFFVWKILIYHCVEFDFNDDLLRWMGN